MPEHPALNRMQKAENARHDVAPPEEEKGVRARIRRAALGGSTGRWLERLTRFGYATRGVVFILVGLVAARAAVGLGATEGTRGVIRAIAKQPFGRVLVGMTAVGLVSYTFWRFVQALFDPVSEGAQAQGSGAVVRRLGFFGSGLFYAVLAFFAVQLTFNLGGAVAATRREWVAWALAMPYGSWIVGFVGAVLVGAGVHAFYRGNAMTFMKLYPPDEPARVKKWVARRVGQIGLSALGLTLCIIGAFVILAAVRSDPDRAVGIAGALDAVGDGPFGALLLGTVALGFVVYGMHCFVLAWYRRVRSSE